MTSCEYGLEIRRSLWKSGWVSGSLEFAYSYTKVQRMVNESTAEGSSTATTSLYIKSRSSRGKPRRYASGYIDTLCIKE